MTSLALTVGLVIVAAAVLYSLLALSGPGQSQPWDSAQQMLLLEKERLYTEIYDLEFDLKTGKLSDKDYQLVRGELMKEAAVVLEKIEGDKAKKDLDKEIETWIKEARGMK